MSNNITLALPLSVSKDARLAEIRKILFSQIGEGPIMKSTTLNHFKGILTAEVRFIKSKSEFYREFQNRKNRYFPGIPI